MAEGNLFQREPALVIGTVAAIGVEAFAKWRGVDTGTVLVQLAGLAAGFVAIRSKVTPYVESALKDVGRLRGRSDTV